MKIQFSHVTMAILQVDKKLRGQLSREIADAKARGSLYHAEAFRSELDGACTLSRISLELPGEANEAESRDARRRWGLVLCASRTECFTSSSRPFNVGRALELS